MNHIRTRVIHLVDSFEGPIATISVSILLLAALVLPLIFINT